MSTALQFEKLPNFFDLNKFLFNIELSKEVFPFSMGRVAVKTGIEYHALKLESLVCSNLLPLNQIYSVKRGRQNNVRVRSVYMN